MQESNAKYVVFGVKENVGIRANGENSADKNVWWPFLESFLNIQSNDFLDGEEIMVLGYFDFSDMENVIEANSQSFDEKTEAYRHAVTRVDTEVEQMVHLITQNKKLPIVISNGNNNAYPCIKGAAKGWYKSGEISFSQVNAVNLDVLSGYGPIEGRHSGNSFRYAEEDGYLEKYCMVGLNENQITQNVWMDIVNNPFLDCITYEDIFIHEKKNFIQAVGDACDFTDDTLCGIEINAGAISPMACNDINASGIELRYARQFVNYAALDLKPAYLHISNEVKEIFSSQYNIPAGKFVSYLVSDFVKAQQQVR